MTPNPNEMERQEIADPQPPSTKDTNPKDGIGSLKPGYAAVPVPVLYELGAALTEGARKYGGYNWRVAGVRTSVYIEAARRHLDSYWEGEDIDPDSGLSHITKAIAGLVVLRDAMIQGKVSNDDRPPRTTAPFMDDGKQRMADLQRRYPDPVANHTQEQLAHLDEVPVNVYPGESKGFEIEVQLPAPTEEGLVWMQQGAPRQDLFQSLAVAQALRDDGYGERVVRVLQRSDRVVELHDGRHVVDGELVRTLVVAFPGDVSLTAMPPEADKKPQTPGETFQALWDDGNVRPCYQCGSEGDPTQEFDGQAHCSPHCADETAELNRLSEEASQ